MSVKYFCDACETEIGRNVVGNRYRPSKYMNHRNIRAEVMVSVEGTWNNGYLCLDCLMKVITSPDCEPSEGDGLAQAG